MCRFVLYRGQPLHLSSLITEPENSLIRQSYASQEKAEPLNGDGFGVAWYQLGERDEAALFRSITPAWNNQNLRHLARAMKSECILAHVRAASVGLAVSETNTHPFVAGRYAFMHNGELADFRRHRRALLSVLDDPYFDRVEGTTDSECLFAHVLQRLDRLGDRSADALAVALEDAIASLLTQLGELGVAAPSYVNAVLTNGASAVVCRYTNAPHGLSASLHIHTGRLYTIRHGLPELVEADEDAHSVIVSSEPLTDDASWQIVPNASVVIIDGVRDVRIRPMVLAAGRP